MAGSDRPQGPSRPAPEYSDFLEYTAAPSDPELDESYPPPPAEPRPPRRPPSGPGGPGGRRGHRRGNILWRWRRSLFVAGLLAMAMVAAGASVVAQVELPDAAALQLQLSSYVCTAEVPAGECTRTNAIAKLSEEGDRDYVQLEDVPQVVVDAVISAEDRSFFEHDGVDPMGIARALYRDLRGGGISQGGSTITQQFVKNTYLAEGERGRDLGRKVREAVLAIKVEQRMSKEEILEGYLNTIYYGRNAYGIQAASRAYFNRDVEQIGLQEATYLAGLIRSPAAADANDPANPEHLQEATRRRGTVLDAMLEEDYISEAEHAMVDATNLIDYVVPKQPFRLTTTYWGGNTPEGPGYGMEYINEYVDAQVKRTLMATFAWTEEEAEAEIAAGGLRIYTTINRDMQSAAYDTVYREILTDQADPAAGLVAVDDQGMIRAMVGGRDYSQNQNNFASMGSGGRQVGSTFKPIALAAALKTNVSPERTHLDAPGEVEFPAGGNNPCDHWTAHNYASEDAATGSLNLFDATAESSNTAYANLMYQLGSQPVLDMAADLGVSRELDVCLPTVLGAEESSPLEMAEVYSTFANRGVHREPTIISRIERVGVDGTTTPLWQWQPQEQRVLQEGAADLVTYALQGVIDHGTGTRADIGIPAAGKTGTTTSNKDAWFVGYVPWLTTAVWMGYPDAVIPPDCDPDLPPDPTDPDTCAEQILPMRGVHGFSSITGGSLPAQIWASFMEKATAGRADPFVEPSPEQRRAGTVLGQGTLSDTTETTLPEDEPDPGGSVPTSVPSTSSTGSTSTSSTSTPTTTPTTIGPWPPSTPTTRDRGGGGASP